MASIVEKKFEWFEQHLRENLKERTLASPFYIGIPKAEDDIFMVFYLRVLLDKLDMQKSLSMISVPDSDRANPRLGYRTSVPVPKGGISAIKVGEVPKFDLDEMIKNTLVKAIKDYLAAAATSPNLTKELASNTDLVKITRTELKNLEKPLMASYSFVKSIFHISDYLRSNNTKFITNRIIDNIRDLHENCVNENCVNTLKSKFPEKQEGDCIYLNPPEWLSVRLGIVPLGVYPDVPDDLLDKFRNGNAAQFVVSEFALGPIDEFKKLIEDLYSATYEGLKENGADFLKNIVAPSQLVHDYHANTLLNIYDTDFVKSAIIKGIDTECCKVFYSVKFATELYATGASDASGFIPPIKDLFETKPSIECNDLISAYDSLVGSFKYDDNGEIIVKEEAPEPESDNTATEESEESEETPPTIDMTDIYYSRLVDLDEAYNYIRNDISRLNDLSESTTSDIWGGKLQNYFGKISWFKLYLDTLSTYLSSFKEDGSEVISKDKIEPGNLKNLKDGFHDLFERTTYASTNMVNDFRAALDKFENKKDSICTNVDAEFIADAFSTIGNYAIKEYKGTIICYKT